MPDERMTANRLAAYSDAVFAVIVTIMVLELKAPDAPTFPTHHPLWATAISYAMSYQLRPSLYGVAPAVCYHMDRTHSSGVVRHDVCAGLFVCIDIAYNLFEHQVLACAAPA